MAVSLLAEDAKYEGKQKDQPNGRAAEKGSGHQREEF
ncbi:hypothetical protein J2X06_002217 [Lysobacter niastensis]|uniref:Uncharacterized protein n=1 Tax=Lysobacter niastensis TaxID=380629 RepID=A0ABU1WBN0_9GAMM|nr:hypothetical protein [Lysobacter niastensis]